MNLFAYDFFKDFGYTLQKYQNTNFADAFSKGQIESKLWLLNTLKDNQICDLGLVYLLAGWYGLLGHMLLSDEKIKCKIRSFDINSGCAAIAESFNRQYVLNNWQFKATTKDIHDIDYTSHKYKTLRANGTAVKLNESPNTIINTSCEHIQNFNGWYDKIPSSRLLILQSNNYYDLPEHVNCSFNLSDFKSKCQMSEVIYSGTLPTEKYDRFMLIGRK